MSNGKILKTMVGYGVRYLGSSHALGKVSWAHGLIPNSSQM
jgi:hypothetical protein